MNFDYKKILLLLVVFSFFCCKDSAGESGGDNQSQAIEDLLKQVKTTKTLNTFDEEACSVYWIEPGSNSPDAKITKAVIRNDIKEGDGAFKINYSFSGKSLSTVNEYVLLEEIWADYRPDLSFHPLGVSLWVKGDAGNNVTLRLMLIQDKTLAASRDKRSYFYYSDDQILNKSGWQRLVIPYDSFKLFIGQPGENLELSRVMGYRIDAVNKDGKASQGEFCIDALEQLTSYEPTFGTPQFSSIFIQLNEVYEHEDWDADFKACKEANINTWIIQYSQGFGTENEVSWYTGTKAPWNKIQYSIVDDMVAAAERQGFKLIFGLFGGDYVGSKSDPEVYNGLYEKNKLVADEIYEKFGSSPCFAGWYITEEFHDGAYPDGGWQKNPARDLLADYLQRVAAYCKSKTKEFPVQIAPALFRGMPADLCGEWFKAIFEKTSDLDVLYLQDIGGRCLVDIDVDLPNYFAEIKKACDATGVEFGVDIESFKDCWCPVVNYRAKAWEELQEQLFVSGMFTKYITNFSWATFKPKTGAFEEYKNYVKSNNLK